MIAVDRLDHLVLTVTDVERACRFYSKVLGMRVVTFGRGRKALAFGSQKINLHLKGHEVEPKAAHPVPGSGDLCFVTSVPIPNVIAHLLERGVEIIAGPVPRTGALGPIESVYLRDPDGNLIEVANSVETREAPAGGTRERRAGARTSG
jgi:catechol 2,3-dioxygenase-like lactoylglutathione lyase family enzyme